MQKCIRSCKMLPLRAAALLLAFCLLLSGLPLSAAATRTESTTFRSGKVLLKEKDFTVTTKSMQIQNGGNVQLKLTLKNTGKNTLRFRSSAHMVDGIGIPGFLYEAVQPGKQATVDVYVDMLAVAATSVVYVNALDVTFDVLNDNTYDTLYENCRITIPVGVPCDLEYNAYEVCLYKDSSSSIYQDSNFSLYLLGAAQPNPNTAPSMIFRLENRLDGPVMVRNNNEFSVSNNQYGFYISETAAAYRSCVFTARPYEDFFDDVSGNTAQLRFPLQICTGNWNPLIDMDVRVTINRDSEILRCSYSSAKSTAYDISMKEYHPSQNLFMGRFHNYQPDPQYISSLRNKHPDYLERYSDDCFIPYVSELLTLYLDNLDQAGYDFGVIERADLCSELSYVVELTEQGKSVIQIAFAINEYDPKAACLMTLGCATNNYEDMDTLNSHLAAMWIAYDTANIHMTEEKHANLILNSETATDANYGVLLRGQYDGLGYVQTTNEREAYLIISPDLSLPLFEGMKVGGTTLEDLEAGDTFFFGSYEQDHNAANGKEPIEWIVLDRDGDDVLAVTAMALDSQPYHKKSGSVSWKTCSLRTWLNGEFYNAAFSKDEKARILKTQVEPRAGKDSVFLLSRDETEAYFPTKSSRLCKASAYAVSRNAYVNSSTGGSWWLLRTAGTKSGCVMSVNSDGSLDYSGGRVESLRGTVRPAIWFSTES